jgi:hypothetical protein
MRISIEVKEDELLEQFRQVFKIVSQDAWRRRAADLADRERKIHICMIILTSDTQSSGSSIAPWHIGRSEAGFRP